MDNRQIIVLYGDSLLMDTVEASLSHCQEIGVMRIHTSVPDVVDRLKKIQPDLVIFDWDAPHCQFVLPFLREQPGAHLLGLDVTCSQAIALTSAAHTVDTAAELVRLIQSQTTDQLTKAAEHNRKRDLIVA